MESYTETEISRALKTYGRKVFVSKLGKRFYVDAGVFGKDLESHLRANGIVYRNGSVPGLIAIN